MILNVSSWTDGINPAKVLNLHESTLSEVKVDLFWDEVIDDDLAYYIIYRNETLIGTTVGLNFTDNDVQVGEVFSYKVRAVDYWNNEGEQSEELIVEVEVTVPELGFYSIFGVMIVGLCFISRKKSSRRSKNQKS